MLEKGRIAGNSLKVLFTLLSYQKIAFIKPAFSVSGVKFNLKMKRSFIS